MTDLDRRAVEVLDELSAWRRRIASEIADAVMDYERECTTSDVADWWERYPLLWPGRRPAVRIARQALAARADLASERRADARGCVRVHWRRAG